MLRFLTIIALIGGVSAPVYAADQTPLTVTADQTLEWRRNDHQFIATGNASAVQGDMSVRATTLTADYREDGGSGMDIYRLTADGGVTIVSGPNTVTGGHAVYEVDTGVATATGGNLKIVTPDQTVTARDRLEYRTKEGHFRAIGDAHAVRQGDDLRAAEMNAWFAKDAAGKTALSRLDASGGVVITTPEEVLTGDRASYDAASNVAALTGHVKITRGPNVLTGETAEINLKTNVSRMTAGSGPNGRVSGVFYPGSVKK